MVIRATMHVTNSHAETHKPNAESAGAEAAGAPEAESEITPEMIRAGERCLDDLLDAAIPPGSGLMCIPGGWAKEVYVAMRRSRPLGA